MYACAVDSVCKPGEVQCGWETFDCVSTLLMCDGRNHCYNGWDESEETCSRQYMPHLLTYLLSYVSYHALLQRDLHHKRCALYVGLYVVISNPSLSCNSHASYPSIASSEQFVINQSINLFHRRTGHGSFGGGGARPNLPEF